MNRVALTSVAGVDAEDVLEDIFMRMKRGVCEPRDEERFGPEGPSGPQRVLDHPRVAARRPAAIKHVPAEPGPAVNDDEHCAVEQALGESARSRRAVRGLRENMRRPWRMRGKLGGSHHLAGSDA